jgi:hypothetical protein
MEDEVNGFIIEWNMCGDGWTSIIMDEKWTIVNKFHPWARDLYELNQGFF